MPNSPLTITTTEGGLVVSGKTFDYKERIKAIGGKWNPETKTWFVPFGLTQRSRPLPSSPLLINIIISLSDASKLKCD
jgi:hypothetical protein